MDPKGYVRTFILSEFKNPPENEFRSTMQQLKNEVLNELSAYCDQLKNNFIHTHGPKAPGIEYCDRAKNIILQSRG